jgi:hypothetical protein
VKEKKALTPAQKTAITRARKKAEADRLAKVEAQRLAQIVNLHIAGYSLAEIGSRIGATASEVDRMIQRDAARYVRSQPSLRVYVRNWVSAKYAELLEADWDEATDKTHPHKLENQDRAIRILERMTRLHGAEAPVQSEVKVEAAPEAVEKLVSVLASKSGFGYDESIFDVDPEGEDVVDAEVVDAVHDAVEQTRAATMRASAEIDDAAEGAEGGWEDG